MSWALSQQIVTDQAARHVLLCLANYADRDGRGAFPSVQALMSDTGLSERSVRYKLDSLQKAGLIKSGDPAIVAAYIKRGDKRPACYDIVMLATPVVQAAKTTVERGAAFAPGESRGANDDITGCKSQQNGVQTTTERGAPRAPNPSLIHQGTINRSKNTPPTPKGESKSVLADPDGFLELWAAYPLKTGRGAAVKAYAALKPSKQLQQTMLEGLATWRKHERWIKDGGKYRHHASTWLNQRLWEDEAVCGKPVVATGLVWWREAGFEHIAEAQNARCHVGNYRKFRNGKRIVEEAHA